MTPVAIGVCVFLVMMVMVFLGIPVFVSMLAGSAIGFLWLYGGDPTMLLTQFTNAPFNLGANYNYAVMPMFMLVGALAGETDIADGAFRSMRTFLGRIKGGLLYTVVAANAVFGACSGLSVAGNIVFSKLAMPELKKNGYNERYSMGCITASGALSSLIPPSMGVIMFCLVAPSPIMYQGQGVNLAVGTALMGGIIPGILTALALCATVRIIGAVKKGSLPPAVKEKVPLKEKLKSLKLLIPILCLFVVIIGGTFAGMFTATVAGAIGAVVVIIYALVKRVPVKRIAYCIWDAAVMEAGIFMIMIGGQIFGRFVADTGIADVLARSIAAVNAPPFIIFLLVLLLYIFCGCVMDIISIIIITVPVVFPVLAGVGYNPYVLVVVLCFVAEIAGLTPPIGMNVFATANALRTNPSEIFKGVLPFFCCELVMVILIAIFPQLVTFLPSLMQ